MSAENIKKKKTNNSVLTTELEPWDVTQAAKPWGPLPVHLTAAQVNSSSEFRFDFLLVTYDMCKIPK